MISHYFATRALDSSAFFKPPLRHCLKSGYSHTMSWRSSNRLSAPLSSTHPTGRPAMTPQEQQLLEDFLQRLSAVQGVSKDPQADALIQQQLAGHPDALYLLVQRSLLQQHALDSAKAQIAQLQAQVGNQQQGGASFLGGQSAWNQPQQQVPPPMPQQAAARSWRERLFGGGAPQPQQGGAPSFLASAATTAAGVAGGMFLFDGIESLIGGHHGGGLFGGGGQPQVIENVTENNFYDDGNGRSNNDGFSNNDNFASTDKHFNNDIADDDFSDSNFDDSSWS